MDKVLGKVVRYGLTAIGGVLVGKGLLSEDAANQLIGVGTEVIVGVLVGALGPAWSIVFKSK